MFAPGSQAAISAYGRCASGVGGSRGGSTGAGKPRVVVAPRIDRGRVDGDSPGRLAAAGLAFAARYAIESDSADQFYRPGRAARMVAGWSSGGVCMDRRKGRQAKYLRGSARVDPGSAFDFGAWLRFRAGVVAGQSLDRVRTRGARLLLPGIGFAAGWAFANAAHARLVSRLALVVAGWTNDCAEGDSGPRPLLGTVGIGRGDRGAFPVDLAA